MPSAHDYEKLLPDLPRASTQGHHRTDSYQSLSSDQNSLELSTANHENSNHKSFSVRKTREESETLVIKTLKRLSIGLHIILALLHVALIVIFIAGKFGYRIVLPKGIDTTSFATTMNTIAQIFMTVRYSFNLSSCHMLIIY
jgi:hypothetical protein